jgi:hypothetical protein
MLESIGCHVESRINAKTCRLLESAHEATYAIASISLSNTTTQFLPYSRYITA